MQADPSSTTGEILGHPTRNEGRPARERGLDSMTYQCELLEKQPQPTLAVRTRSSVERLPQVLGPAWGAIMQHAGRMGVQPSGPPFVAYHNMDMQDLDLEIGFPFLHRLAGEGDILAGETPGGRAAVCLHTGPYDQIHLAYEALRQWVEANGYVPTGVVYEFYLNDPRSTPATELQTQVLLPLQ